jgi:branched-subunit amino acid transport protein
LFVAEDGGVHPISPATLAGAVALLVSWRSKNLALSVVCGLVAYVGFDLAR